MGPLDFYFGCISALWLGGSGLMLFRLRWAQRLPGATATPGTQPTSSRVSAVIAARNEEARIESTVRHLLAQQGISIEIVVVNDRSTDQTGQILARLAAEDSRVRALRVEALPPDWLGKCHACHVGAQAATGDWILFTDADCWLKPDVVARALSVAEKEKADHVTLTPGVATITNPAKAWHLAFLLSLVDWFAGVNRDRPRSHMGMGAFNLVRRDAYLACGGYESLRLTVVDDVKLGLLLRRAGRRTRAFIGGDDDQCQWGTTLREMIRLMEKNYFAVLDYRTGLTMATVLFGFVVWGSAAVGAFTGNAGGFLALASLASHAVPATVVARRLGWGMPGPLLVPLIYPAMFYAILRSMVITLARGGVRWRDTFHPLAMLRRGNLR